MFFLYLSACWPPWEGAESRGLTERDTLVMAHMESLGPSNLTFFCLVCNIFNFFPHSLFFISILVLPHPCYENGYWNKSVSFVKSHYGSLRSCQFAQISPGRWLQSFIAGEKTGPFQRWSTVWGKCRGCQKAVCMSFWARKSGAVLQVDFDFWTEGSRRARSSWLWRKDGLKRIRGIMSLKLFKFLLWQWTVIASYFCKY